MLLEDSLAIAYKSNCCNINIVTIDYAYAYALELGNGNLQTTSKTYIRLRCWKDRRDIPRRKKSGRHVDFIFQKWNNYYFV